MDEDAAKHTMFGSLAASGWHTASLTMRLLLESALAGVSGRGLGVRINDITWSSPVRPGDEFHAVSEVLDLRPSRSKPDRGLVIMKTTTRNQRGEAVQEMTSTLLILRSDAVLDPAHFRGVTPAAVPPSVRQQVAAAASGWSGRARRRSIDSVGRGVPRPRSPAATSHPARAAGRSARDRHRPSAGQARRATLPGPGLPAPLGPAGARSR